LGEIFDVVALVVIATFAEETVMYNVMDIQLVKERITILETISKKVVMEGLR
jgi:hypothetical protein